MKFIFCCLTLLLSSCVHEPPETRMVESHERVEKGPWPDSAVVLDVRKRFEYELGHWPKAYNLPAHEATKFDRDLKRRLALFGVNRFVPVILVGNEKPQALAEQLKSNLDLRDVKAYSLDDVKLAMTREEPPKPETKPLW